MYKHIVQFFMWLFPILKQATIQVLAEEIHKIAYPNHPYRRPFNYQRFTQRGTDRTAKVDLDEVRDYAEKDVADTMSIFRENPATPFDLKAWEAGNRVPQIGFHDVLMVAFDLTGPNAYKTHEWLMEQLPATGDHEYDGNNINLDAWWVANDERFDGSDTDSAVFVKKGNQTAAREQLRAFGLVD